MNAKDFAQLTTGQRVIIRDRNGHLSEGRVQWARKSFAFIDYTGGGVGKARAYQILPINEETRATLEAQQAERDAKRAAWNAAHELEQAHEEAIREEAARYALDQVRGWFDGDRIPRSAFNAIVRALHYWPLDKVAEVVARPDYADEAQPTDGGK